MGLKSTQLHWTYHTNNYMTICYDMFRSVNIITDEAAHLEEELLRLGLNFLVNVASRRYALQQELHFIRLCATTAQCLAIRVFAGFCTQENKRHMHAYNLNPVAVWGFAILLGQRYVSVGE